MFEGDSADTCAKKFPLKSMGGGGGGGGRVGARTPIGVSRIGPSKVRATSGTTRPSKRLKMSGILILGKKCPET